MRGERSQSVVTLVALFIFSALCGKSAGLFSEIVGEHRLDHGGIKKFVKWYTDKGFRLHENAVFKREDSRQGGVNVYVQVVNNTVLAGEELVVCPYRYLLPPWLPTRQTAAERKLLGSYFDPREMLSVRLLYEVGLGVKSKWANYLRILPTPDELKHMPFFWDDAVVDSEKLAGTFLRYEIVESTKRVEMLHQKIVGSKILPRYTPTLLEVKWAVSIVFSRAFMVQKEVKNTLRLDGMPFLAPLADMLNHGYGSKIRYTLGSNAPKVKRKKQKQKRKFKIIGLQTFEPSEELTINYLSSTELTISNQKTYIHYGFCSETILPTDTIPLDFTIPLDADPSNRRREEIRQATNTPNSFFIYNKKKRPEKLIDWFLIMQMEESELEAGAPALAHARASAYAKEAALQAMKTMVLGFKKEVQDAEYVHDSCTDRIIRFEQTIVRYHVSEIDKDLRALYEMRGEREL